MAREAAPPSVERIIVLGDEYEALLARAADTMPMGMTLCDASRPDYPIVYCNPGFERLTGFTADEVLSRPFEQSHLRSKMERMIVVARLEPHDVGEDEAAQWLVFDRRDLIRSSS